MTDNHKGGGRHLLRMAVFTAGCFVLFLASLDGPSSFGWSTGSLIITLGNLVTLGRHEFGRRELGRRVSAKEAVLAFVLGGVTIPLLIWLRRHRVGERLEPALTHPLTVVALWVLAVGLEGSAWRREQAAAAAGNVSGTAGAEPVGTNPTPEQ